MKANADLLSIAQLPPGHDPGACYGVATAALQRWHLAIRYFGSDGGLGDAAGTNTTSIARAGVITSVLRHSYHGAGEHGHSPLTQAVPWPSAP